MSEEKHDQVAQYSDEEWRLHQVHLEKRLRLIEMKLDQLAVTLTGLLENLAKMLTGDNNE